MRFEFYYQWDMFCRPGVGGGAREGRGRLRVDWESGDAGGGGGGGGARGRGGGGPARLTLAPGWPILNFLFTVCV